MPREDKTVMKAEILIFQTGEKKYAFSAELIVRVMAIPRYTPVPLEIECLLGVFNYKNEIVPLYSTQKIMNGREEHHSELCIIVNSHKGLIGYVVDFIDGIFSTEKAVQLDSQLVVLKGNLKIISTIRFTCDENDSLVTILGI